ncbi:hypothetical protein CAOG_07817 [Capsaspora owczarzaki ATCC 30864]|uniref:Nicastrin n=1 Tax=Capsaspora owczarzaki (strain ATCC 30864) TaxID=595528 RepID=A0A0D2W0I4_CAPO3|nr:hypothetical protein CAOG_07817 [Capsaspora owczarzaki ATCC 30864]KJE97712.1 hypothetical protein CAOG_007817 [Capsaspora owczarzaki ATCC 30864]|eukprot:XP_004342890.1 hypothetical protein CAOG_07817 [Capsaspora owczarzaki ATCC 30864]
MTLSDGRRRGHQQQQQQGSGGALRLALVVVAVAMLQVQVARADDTLNKLSDKVYQSIPLLDFCAMLLDSDGEVGCASSLSGNVGVLYSIQSDADLSFFIHSAERSPYSVVTTPAYFNLSIIEQLEATGKMNGLIILSDATRPTQSSHAPKCPNCKHGLYANTDAANYAWNPEGSGLTHRRFQYPIYWLGSTSAETIRNRALSNAPKSGVEPDYPLWAVEMNSFMYAGGDSNICLRRGSTWCEPLGSQSIWGSTRPIRSGDTYVLATAAIDALSLFHKQSFGAEADAAAVVALLAAADALAKEPTTITLPHNIMFMLLNGEKFDYTGSSAIANQIATGNFPSASKAFGFDDIKAVLDVEQIGLLDSATGPIYLHIDSNSTDPVAVANVASIVNAQVTATAGFAANIINNTATGLPPASLQAFLKESRGIPGVVVTDHGLTFNNKLYGTPFDDATLVNASDAATVNNICNVALAIANSLYALASDNSGSVPAMTVNCTFVQSLLTCLTVNEKCALFQQTGNNLPSNLPSRYVSVFRTNTIFAFIYALRDVLAVAVASDSQPSLSQKACNNAKLTYIAPGLCLNTTVAFIDALSPGFDFDNFAIKNQRWNLWAESVWGSDPSMNLFLRASYSSEVVIIVVGFIILGISIAVVWPVRQLIHKKYE